MFSVARWRWSFMGHAAYVTCLVLRVGADVSSNRRLFWIKPLIIVPFVRLKRVAAIFLGGDAQGVEQRGILLLGGVRCIPPGSASCDCALAQAEASGCSDGSSHQRQEQRQGSLCSRALFDSSEGCVCTRAPCGGKDRAEVGGVRCVE